MLPWRPRRDSSTGLRTLQKDIHAADQLPVGGDIDRNEIVPVFWLHMTERRKWAQNSRIADQNIEALVSFVERQREARNAVAVLDVKRHQCGRTASRPDLVVELFEAADRAGYRNHMRASLRERKRGCGTDATRGAGDQRDAVGKGLGVIGHSRVRPRQVPGIHVFCSVQA